MQSRYIDRNSRKGCPFHGTEKGNTPFLLSSVLSRKILAENREKKSLICLFEQQFTSTFSIQQILDKSIKNRELRDASLAKYTKSDNLTMETIPNCTNLRDVFERKIK